MRWVEGSLILWMGSAGPGTEHAQGGQQPTIGQQLGCPPDMTQQPLSGRRAQAMAQGDGGGLRRKRRKEGVESKVQFFLPTFGQAVFMLFSVSGLADAGRKTCCPKEQGMSLAELQQRGEKSRAEAVGDINDIRIERMQPKCAGFSLMDCLPSLLPWGQ